MIRSNGYTLTCDGEGCKVKVKASGVAKSELLFYADKRGWKFHSAVTHLCPTCAKKEADRENHNQA